MRTHHRLTLVGLLALPVLGANPAAPPTTPAGATTYTVVFSSNRTGELNPCG